MNQKIAELAEYLAREDEFLLLAHLSPDGDTLGACLALCRALTRMGKKAVVTCHHPVPKVYRFLPGAQDVCLPSDAPAYRNVLAIDAADRERLGSALPLFDAARYTANVDHHRTNTRYARHNLVDDTVAATGELVYELIKALPVTVDEPTAQCLYTAIITDTGNFSYSNTIRSTFLMAAELMETGLNISRINTLVYRTQAFAKKKLEAAVINGMELYAGGRLGVATLSLEDMRRIGADEEDTEGVIDHIRDVETVQIAIFVRESVEGKSRANLRSKEGYDVAKLAARFGGGGHEHAAGASLDEPLAAACEKLVAAALHLLEG